MARLSCDDCGCDPTILTPQCKKKCDCNSHEHKFNIWVYDGEEQYMKEEGTEK